MRQIRELQAQVDATQQHPQLAPLTQAQVDAYIQNPQYRSLTQVQADTTGQQPQNTSLSSTTAIDNTTPLPERSYWYPYPGGYQPPADLHAHYASIMPVDSRPHSPTTQSSAELSRQSSHRSHQVSDAPSPALRPTSAVQYSQEEGWSGERMSRLDDIGHYQAETQNLIRENQILRQRIRELGMGLYVPLRPIY